MQYVRKQVSPVQESIKVDSWTLTLRLICLQYYAVITNTTNNVFGQNSSSVSFIIIFLPMSIDNILKGADKSY